MTQLGYGKGNPLSGLGDPGMFKTLGVGDAATGISDAAVWRAYLGQNYQVDWPYAGQDVAKIDIYGGRTMAIDVPGIGQTPEPNWYDRPWHDAMIDLPEPTPRTIADPSLLAIDTPRKAPGRQAAILTPPQMQADGDALDTQQPPDGQKSPAPDKTAPPALYFDQVIVTEETGWPKLLFTLSDRRKKMTEEAVQLYRDVAVAEQLIRDLVASSTHRTQLMKELAGIAHAGLIGPVPDVAAAASDLDRFRSQTLIAHLQRFRDWYAVKNTVLMVATVVVALGTLWGIVVREPALLSALGQFSLDGMILGSLDPSLALSCLAAFLFGLVGFAIGEIFTGFRAAQTVDLASYRTNPRFRLSPWLRLFYGASTWFIALAFLALDWIILGLGGTTINDAAKGSPVLGLVGGLVIAVAFDKFVDVLSNKSAEAVAPKTS